jgi:hypothetical protein
MMKLKEMFKTLRLTLFAPARALGGADVDVAPSISDRTITCPRRRMMIPVHINITSSNNSVFRTKADICIRSDMSWDLTSWVTYASDMAGQALQSVEQSVQQVIDTTKVDLNF